MLVKLSMKWVRLVWLSLALSRTAFAVELPTHWTEALNTQQIEAVQSKISLLEAFEKGVQQKKPYLSLETRKQLFHVYEQNDLVKPLTEFDNELRIQSVVEVIGILEKYQNEEYDFSIRLSIKPPSVWSTRSDGSRFWAYREDQLETPEQIAYFHKKNQEYRVRLEEDAFQRSIRNTKEHWIRSFTDYVYGLFSNPTQNAIDRAKAKRVYELIRVANIPDKTRQRMNFWLTMMVECDKSLVKLAREKNDQTCAEHVKQLGK